jgi:hypothetical protein
MTHQGPQRVCFLFVDYKTRTLVVVPVNELEATQRVPFECVGPFPDDVPEWGATYSEGAA